MNSQLIQTTFQYRTAENPQVEYSCPFEQITKMVQLNDGSVEFYIKNFDETTLMIKMGKEDANKLIGVGTNLRRLL